MTVCAIVWAAALGLRLAEVHKSWVAPLLAVMGTRTWSA